MILPKLRRATIARRILSGLVALCLTAEPVFAGQGFYFRLNGTGGDHYLKIEGPSPIYGHVGSAMRDDYAAENGSAPYLWGMTGLPDGITMADGTVSGIPTATGTSQAMVTVTDAVGATASLPVEVDIFGSLVVSGASDLETGVGIAAHTVPLSVTGSPVNPVKFTLESGSLPPGMQVDPSSGEVVGTPTKIGSYTLSIRATDATGADAITSSFTITVDDMLEIAGGGLSLVARVGQTYASPYPNVSGGAKPPMTWTLQTGTLPDGLTVSQADGRVVGKPTAVSAVTPFTEKVIDGANRYGKLVGSISVLDGLAFGGSPASAFVGYMRQGVAGAYTPPGPLPRPQKGTWSLASGALPPNTTLNPKTGVVSGIPQAPTAPFDVLDTTFTLAYGEATGGGAITPPITIHVYGPLYLNHVANVSGTVDAPLKGPAVTYTGNLAGKFSWSLSGANMAKYGIPAGLTYDSNSGAISGAAKYGFNAQVQDNVTDLTGTFSTNAFGLSSQPKFPMSFMSDETLRQDVRAAIPPPVAGAGYAAPLTFSVSPDGGLPAGLALDPKSGAITGTPTVAGTTSIAIVATDATNSASGTNTFDITVQPPVGIAIDADGATGALVTGPTAASTHTGFQVSLPLTLLNGPVAPVTWSVDPSTSLPAGLIFTANADKLTARVSGSVAKAGDVSFVASAKDRVGNKASATIAIHVVPPIATTAPTLVGRIGTTTNQKDTNHYGTATGGVATNVIGDVTWFAPDDGSYLPSGLVYETAGATSDGTPILSGMVSGTPQGPAGQITLEIGVHDALDTPTQPSRAVSSLGAGTIVPRLGLDPVPPVTLTGAAGHAVTPTPAMTLTNGPVGKVQFVLDGQLPDGLRFDVDTGVISGVPTDGADATVAVFGTDSILERTNAAFVQIHIDYGVSLGDPNGTLPDYATRAGSPVYQPPVPPVATNANPGPLTWTLDPAIPGVTLDGTGAMSGTPTTPGKRTTTYRVVDSVSNVGRSGTFAFTVQPPLTMDGSDRTDSRTVPLDVTLAQPAPDAVTPLAWQITGLPDGLTYDATSGEVRGTPTKLGDYNVSVAVNDGHEDPSDVSFVWHVVSPTSVGSTSDDTTYLGNAKYAKAGPGGSSPNGRLTWTFDPTTPPPAGLSVAPTSGDLVGTPKALGSTTMRLLAKDPTGASGLSDPFTITVVPPLSIATADFAGREGLPTQVQAFTRTGGVGVLRYSFAAGTPDFFSVDVDGNVSATPPAGSAKSYNLAVTVTDEAGETLGAAINAVVLPPLSLAMTDQDAKQDEALSIAVPAPKPKPVLPITWKATGLPRGLKFDGATISGTPLDAVTRSVTLSGTDAQGATFASNAFNVAVHGPLTIAMSGKAYAAHLGQNAQIPAPTVGTNPKGPLTITVDGALPQGIVAQSDGSAKGSATQQTQTTNTVTVRDGYGRTATSDQFTVTVLPPLVLGAISNGRGRVGFDSRQAQAPGVSGSPVSPLTWTLATGTLPKGTRVDPVVGGVVGKPTTEEAQTVSIALQDGTGASVTSNRFTVQVLPELTVQTPADVVVHAGAKVTIAGQILGGGPISPVTWTLDGKLPAGVTMDDATGAITGTANGLTAIDNQVTLTATDGMGASVATKAFAVAAIGPLALAPIPDRISSVGHKETIGIHATNVVGDAAYVASAPVPGLAFDKTFVTLTGAPTDVGDFPVTYTVTDATGTAVSQSFKVSVLGPFSVGASRDYTLRVGTPGTKAAPSTTNGVPTVGNFRAAAGFTLPAGMALDPTTGVVSGTPTTIGSSGFAYQVTDGDGRQATGAPFSFNVFSALTIGTAGSFVMRDGVMASVPAPKVGNDDGYGTWTVAPDNALPRDFVLDQTSGAVSGTPGPSLDGTSLALALTYTDSSGNSISDNLPGQAAQLTFLAPLAMRTPFTSYAHVNVPITFAPLDVANGPVAPEAWEVMTGGLPDGLALDPLTGSIHGTPTTEGTNTVALTVVDATFGSASTGPFDLQVLGAMSMAAGTNLTVHNSKPHVIDAPNLANGSPQTTWALLSPVPGLSVTADTGQLRTATGMNPGAFHVTEVATDAGASANSGDFVITVLPPLGVATPADSGVFTTGPVTVPGPVAKNASGPLTYTLASGKVPPGLSLVSLTGALVGTPQVPGNYSLSLQVQDGTGDVAVTDSYNVAVADDTADHVYPSTLQYVTDTVATGSLAAIYDGSDATLSDPPSSASYVLTFPKFVLADSFDTSRPFSGTSSLKGIIGAEYNAGTKLSPVWKPFQSGSPSLSNQFRFRTRGVPVGIARLRVGYHGAFPALVPSTAPSARVYPYQNTPYGASLGSMLSVANVTGTPTWTVASGTLPAGLTMDGSGNVSGTPAAIGDVVVTVQVTDASGIPSVPATVTFSVQSGVPADALRPLAAYDVGSGVITRSLGGNSPGSAGGLSPHSDPMKVSVVYDNSHATAATAYAANDTVSSIGWIYNLTNFWSGTELDFAQPVRWDGTADAHTSNTATVTYWYNAGTPQSPSWQRWSSATGMVSATQFQVIGWTQACNNCGYGAPSRSFALDTARLGFGGRLPAYSPVISDGIATVTNDAPASVSLAGALSYQGGAGTASWALTSGTLPAGLTLDPTGTIGGTTTVSSTTVVDLQFTATDSTGATTSPAKLHLTAAVGPVLYAGTQGLVANAPASASLATAMNATNVSSATWTSTALPAGLALSRDGTLSGTPTAAGSSVVTVTVTNGNGQKISQPLTIYVDAAPSLTAASSFVSQAKAVSIDLAKAMSATNAASGTYVVDALPLALAASSAGVISGSTLDQGPFAINVTVTTPHGLQATAVYTLTVIAPPTVTPASTTVAAGRPLTVDLASLMQAQNLTQAVFTATGLPGTLSLSGAGTLSGTPTTNGTYAIPVTVTNLDGSFGSANLTLMVATAPSISAATSITTTGQQVTLGLDALMKPQNVTGTEVWTAASGSLPAGLTLDSEGGVFGVPTTTGFDNPTLVVVLTDDSGLSSLPTALAVSATAQPTITTAAATLAVGRPVTTALVVAMSGVNAGYANWTATGLPAGVALSASGLLTGTPTAAGTSTVVVTATNGTDAASLSSMATLALTIDVPPTLTTASRTVPVNKPVSIDLKALLAAGATVSPAYTAAGLPPTLTLSATGVLTGTPTAVATYVVPVTVTNADGLSTTVNLTLGVANQPTLTSATAQAFVNVAFSNTVATLLTPTNMPAPTWAMTGLPAGFAYVASTGQITGTPTAAGTSVVAVTATASNGLVATGTLTLAVTSTADGSAVYPSLVTNGWTNQPQSVAAMYDASAATNATINSASVYGSGSAFIEINYAQPTRVDGQVDSVPGNLPLYYNAGTDAAPNWTPVTGVMVGTKFRAYDMTGTQNPGVQVFKYRIGVGGSYPAYLPSLAPTTTNVVVGEAANVNLDAVLASANVVGGESWVLASGTLPSGLTLNANGTITGTTTSATGATVTVTLTDSRGIASVPTSLTVSPVPRPTLSAGAATIASGRAVSTPIATYMAGTNLAASSWTATGLPAGVTITPSGTLTGKPTAAGVATASVTATNGTGASAVTATATLTVTVDAPPAIVAATVATTAGQAATRNLVAVMGATGLSTPIWTSTTLPTGLTLSTAGVLSGTPAANAPASTLVTATVTNGDGLTTSATLTVTVSPPPALQTATLSFATTIPGSVDLNTPMAVSGLANATWAATGLPAWATLSPAGVLSGTPTVVGSAPVTVTVTNANGGVGSGTLTLNAVAATLASATFPSTLTHGPIGAGTIAGAYDADATTTVTIGQSGNYSQTQAFFEYDFAAPITADAVDTDGAGITATYNTGTTASPVWSPVSGTVTATQFRFLSSVTAGGLYSNTFGRLRLGYHGVSPTAPNVMPGTLTLAVNAAASKSLDALMVPANVTGTETWTVVSGPLPAGLSITGSTLSGTPTAIGTTPVTLAVEDGSGLTTDGKVLTITVAVPPTLSNASTLIGTGRAASINAPTLMSAANGSSPTYAASGLPGTLAISPAGLITGTPTSAGTYQVAVTMTNASTLAATATLSLTIDVSPTLTAAHVGVPTNKASNLDLSALMAPTGLSTPTWTANAMSSGLTLSPAGILTGTLTAAGVTTPTVTVTNADGLSASATLTVLPLSPAVASLPSGLLAYYTFDEGSGLTAADASGNGYTLTTYTNAAQPSTVGQWTASGFRNGGAQVDGAHYFQSSTSVLTGQPRTESVWFKTTATTGTMISGGRSAYGGDGIAMASNGVQFTIGNQSQYCQQTGVGSYSDNLWHLATMTYDGSTMTGYVDGAQVVGTPCSAANSINILEVGGFMSAGYTSSLFTGGVDEAGVWNRALTATEVFNVYNSGTGNGPMIVKGGTATTLHVGSALSIAAPSVKGAYVAPLAFDVTGGTLPLGTSVNATTGAISGTPTTAGSYPVSVRATDVNGSQGSTPSFTVTVLAALSATTPATTTVAKGVAVTIPAPKVSNASGTPAFALASGSVPTGTTLSTTTGGLVGTPTATGPFTYAVTVTDGVGGSFTTPSATVTVDVPPSLTGSTVFLAQNQSKTVDLSTQLAATGIATPTWTATGLPANVTVSPAGILSGVQTAVGSTTFTATVTNADGLSASATVTLTTSAPPTLTSASKTIATGVAANVSLATVMSAQDATGATYAATGLPGTLVVSGAGVLTGTPTATGSYAVTVTATNPDTGGTGSATLTVAVNAPPAITAASTSGYQMGTAVSTNLATLMGATGLATPSWTATGLPSWATLSGAGVLTGTPNAGGSTTTTVTVTNADGLSASATLTVSVVAGVSLSAGTASGTVGAAFTGSLPTLMSAMGLSSPTWSASGLPAGVTLTDAANGVLSGTPTAAGTSTVAVTVTNAGGATASANLTLTVASNVSTTGLSNGLLAYWRYDEGSGTVATDSVGGHNATLGSGQTWTTGVANGAIATTGASFATASWNLLPGASPRTQSTWFKTTSTAFQIVMQLSTGNGGADQASLCLTGPRVGWCPGSDWTPTTYPATYADGAWHMLTATYDGSRMTIYLDGASLGSSTIALTANNVTKAYLGGTGGSSYNFAGSMDEAEVWNRALSASEVSALFSTKSLPATQTATSGQLALFHMDEGAGSTITDSVSGRVATVTNAAWNATGASGSALTFTGASSSYATSPWGLMTGGVAHTQSVWFKTTSAGSTAMGLLSWGNTTSGQNQTSALYMQSGKVMFSDNGPSTPTTTGSYADGAWHMATGTYDGSTMTLYVDGATIGSATNVTMALSSSNLFIGEGASANYQFTGSLDEAAVWGRALSASEVATLYNAGTPAKTANAVNLANGLVASWHLDEPSGTTAADAASGLYPLTVNGTLGATGKIGGAATFSGATNQYAYNSSAWASATPITGATARTQSAWFKTTVANQAVISWGQGGGAVSELQLDASGRVALYNGTASVTGGQTGLNDGTWHLGTVTYDGTTATVYVDGARQASGALAMATGGSNLGVGTRTGSSLYFNGAIDEPAVWSRALNASEVATLYGGGAGQSTNPPSLSTGQVAFYKLDDASGATAADSAGTSPLTFAGTVSSQWTTGVTNGAAAFNGSDYAVNASWNQITGAAPRTMSAWFKAAPGSNGNNAKIMAWGTTASNTYSGISVFNGTIGFSGSSNDLAVGSAGYIDGNWHLVTVTYDGSNMLLYLDGSVKTSGTKALATGAGGRFSLGASFDGALPFAGSIDEAGVWSRALSASEVQTLYLSKSPTAAPALSNGTLSAVAGQVFSGSAATATGAAAGSVSNWAVTGGSLPQGLAIDPASGVVSGTAATAGTSTATVTATGRNGATSSATLTITVTQPTTSTGLLDLWHFDEGAGTIANDAVGGRNGAITSATWSTPGVSGGALTFTGSTSSSVRAPFSGLTGAAPRTMSVWFSTSASIGTNIYGLMGYGTSSTGQQAALQMGGSSGLLAFTAYNSDVQVPMAPYVDGRWHQAVYTYDGAMGTLYVDGQAKASLAQTLNTVGSGSMYVGGGANGDAALPGSIDEPAVWNRALSAGEVAQLFGQGAPQAPQTLGNGLAAMFHMDEGAGTTTTDAVSGRVATTAGSPTWGAGASGSSLTFSGANNATAPWGQMTGNVPRSMSAWIKTTTGGNALGIIGWGGTGQYQQSELCLSTSTAVGFCGSGNDLYFAANYTDGNWHMVTDTWDGSTMTVYFDGAKIGSGSVAALQTTSSTLTIGSNTANGFYYKGAVDEAGVWSRSLSASEVAALYNAGAPAKVSNAVNLTQGQVAYWRFEEQTGTTVSDAAGSFPLTFGGTAPTWNPKGVIGGGVSMTGAGYARSASNNTVTGANTFTMSGWFKTTSASLQGIVTTGAGSGGNMASLEISSTGQASLNFYGSGNQLLSQTSGYADGTWHLATGTFDGGTARIYVDGALRGSLAVTPNVTAGPFSIGGQAGATGYMNGSIDEAGVWNRALNVSEVAALYNQGLGASPNSPVSLSTGQVAYYKLDEASGTTAVDSVGTYPVTLTGSPARGAGVSNGDLVFSGSNYGSGPFGQLTGAAPKTLSAWVKTTSTTMSYGGAANIGTNATTNTGFTLCFNGNTVGVCASGTGLLSQQNFADGNWHLVTATYDGTTLRAYLDAVQTGATTVNLITASAPIIIGANAGGAPGFVGSVDEVGVWGRALSPAELQALYATKAPTSAPTLSAGSAFAVAGQAFNASAPTLMGAAALLPASWSVVGGALPPGVYLDPASGALSGTAPATAGSYAAQVQATGQNGATATATLTVTVGTTLKTGAVRLDGSTGYVTLPASASAAMFSGSSFQGYTVEAWVNFAATGSYPRIVDLNTAVGASNAVSIGENGGATSFFGFMNSGAGSYITGGSFAVGGWTHVAVTQTPGGVQTLYANGVQVATASGVSVPGNVVRSASYVGRSTGSAGDSLLNGTVADVQIYGRALSAAEVASSKAGGTQPGIQARYFTGAASATDGVGANAGVVTGGVTFPGTSFPY